MKQNIGFDHLIGQANSELSEGDLKKYQKLIKAHSDMHSIESRRSNLVIKLRLEMED